jgi:hypothetical protein
MLDAYAALEGADGVVILDLMAVKRLLKRP